jgi:hypothetical protein
MDFLREAGAGGFLVVALLLPALGLGIAHAAAAKRGTLIGAVAVIVGLLAVGEAASVLTGMRLDRALREVDPSMQAMLRAMKQTASYPLYVATVAALIALVPTVIGEVRRRGRAA